MSLVLYHHPLASYCWKALFALHETGTSFTPHLVDLGDPAQRAALAELWPFAKFPVLHDTVSGQVIPESTILIEYLGAPLIPADPAIALETRLRDRFFDLHVHEPMQRIVADRLRPADQRDPLGVAQAHHTLAVAYAEANRFLHGRTWANGHALSLADCAAAPALWYANRVAPIPPEHTQLHAYLARLVARPSFARVLAGSQPYQHLFPG